MANVQHRAEIDDDGNILGFYPSDIFPTAPNGCVEISEEQYTRILAGQSDLPNSIYRLVNGELITATPPAPPAPPES